MTTEYGFRTPEELAVGYWIWVITVPLLVVVGTVGNVLSLLVLCRRKMRETASTVNLFGLAVVDLMMLYGDAMTMWVSQVLGLATASKSDIYCRLQRFVITMSRDTSAWILAAITTERVLATMLPTRYQSICSRKSAGISLSVISIMAILIDGHVLVGYGVDIKDIGNGTTMKVCGPVMNYDGFLKFWPIIHLVKSCILPVLIMVSGSICILGTLARKRPRNTLPTTSVSNTGNRRTIPALSRLLLGLNAVFICTTLPVVLYTSIDPFLVTLDIPMFIKARDPTLAALLMLNYMNHVLNFLLYCFTGSRFREELNAMFSAWKARVSP